MPIENVLNSPRHSANGIFYPPTIVGRKYHGAMAGGANAGTVHLDPFRTLHNWLKPSEAGKLNGPGASRHDGTDGTLASAGGEQAHADRAGNRNKSGGRLNGGVRNLVC